MQVSPVQPQSLHSLLVALKPEIIRPAELALVDEIYTIGRAVGCSIMVQDQLVSRLHARVERQGPHYIIADAGSANGTYINGRRLLESQPLRNEDEIGLGGPLPLLRLVDPDATVFAAGVLRYDERERRFFLSGIALSLPPHQFQLLHHLYLHAGDICTRASCVQAVWSREYDHAIDAGVLDTSVSELRRAMREVDPTVDLIETRRGVGYLLRL